MKLILFYSADLCMEGVSLHVFADQCVSGLLGGRVGIAGSAMSLPGTLFGGTAYSMAMPLFSRPAAAAAASASLQPFLVSSGAAGAAPWALGLGSAALPTIPVSGFSGHGSHALGLDLAGRGSPPGHAVSLPGNEPAAAYSQQLIRSRPDTGRWPGSIIGLGACCCDVLFGLSACVFQVSPTRCPSCPHACWSRPHRPRYRCASWNSPFHFSADGHRWLV